MAIESGVRIVHIFSLDGVGPSFASDDEYAPSGMYDVHRSRTSGLGLRRRVLGSGMQVQVNTDDPVDPPWARLRRDVAAELEIVGVPDGLMQLHMTTVHQSVDEARLDLGLLCHNRASLAVTDGAATTELCTYLSDALGSAVVLGADVHQQVVLPEEAGPAWRYVVDPEGRPTDFGRSFVFRARPFEVTSGFRPLDGGLFVPSQLNRHRESACLLGRGVSVLQRHGRSHQQATLFICSTQLFALARLRLLRDEAASLLALMRPTSRGDVRQPAASEVGELADKVRWLRLSLVNEVTAFADGLSLPESLLDEFRRYVAAALGLPELQAVTSDLVETLAEVAESLRHESAATRDRAQARADSRWAALVAVISAVTIPPLILLAYFGVNSTVDLNDKKSIFDWGRYAGPWGFAVLLLLVIICGSLWVLFRNRSDANQGHRVLISAHRGGPEGDMTEPDSLEAIADAARTGADLVEFDVQLAESPGQFVIRHAKDPKVSPNGLVPLQQVLAAVHRSAVCHVDIKFDPHVPTVADVKALPAADLRLFAEVEVAEQCLRAVGGWGFIVTSRHPATVAALVAWRDADAARSGVRVGLSLGQFAFEPTWRTKLSRFKGELFADAQVLECGADLVAAHSLLCRLRLRRWAARSGLPLLVWTVDDEAHLARWLRDPLVWGLTTNYPRRALAVRDAISR